MAELVNNQNDQHHHISLQLTPTTINNFTFQKSAHTSVLLQQGKPTKVQLAAKKVLVAKANDMQIVDLKAKNNEDQFEVRRTDALCQTSSASGGNDRKGAMSTYDVKLSQDGRTVTSLRLTENNTQVLEVWDSGKSSICRVNFERDEQVTAFLQARLIDKNCLFACVKKLGGSQGSRATHELRGFEIGQNGEQCDFWLQVDLNNSEELLARDLWLGSDALYVNLDSTLLYKLDILKELYENDFDSLEVTKKALADFTPFQLQYGDVFSVNELENKSDAWRLQHKASDLLAVTYEDGTVEIFDRKTADSLKQIRELPEPFADYQCEMIEVAVTGDQLVILGLIVTPEFHGPVIFYLDEEHLELQIRAQIRMPGPIFAASFVDEETVDIVTQPENAHSYVVTNLTVIDESEQFLKDVQEYDQMPQGEEQREMIRQLLANGLYQQLAEMVLEHDSHLQKFALSEKGDLKIQLDDLLKDQLQQRIGLILQAIKNSSGQMNHQAGEKAAILQRISDEQYVLDGIHTVYKALLQRQTIVALENKSIELKYYSADQRDGQNLAHKHDVQAIEGTKEKIAGDIVRRKMILQAIDFFVRSNFTSAMNKVSQDLSMQMSNESLLLYDLLRQAPAHLRLHSKMPLTQLEDLICLFDAHSADLTPFLPHAIVLYHYEAYLNNSNDKSLNTEIIDSSFIPVKVQRVVQSIYQVDKMLTSYGNIEPELLVKHVLDILKNDCLVRAQTLLAILVSKAQYSTALLVASHPDALENAHKENQLEEFVTNAVTVFIKLGKVEEAFEFLDYAEHRLYQSSKAFTTAISSLIEHIVSQPKSMIETHFLSQIFTKRQEQEIDRYLSQSKPNLQVVRDFWNRRSVKGVGLAMKLNWEEHNDNIQLKEIRKEGVRLYTGDGSHTSKDGIFTQSQKWAAQKASGLNRDALDLQVMQQTQAINDKDAMQVDSKVNEDDWSVNQDQQMNAQLAQNLIDPFAAQKDDYKSASLSSFFFATQQTSNQVAVSGSSAGNQIIGQVTQSFDLLDIAERSITGCAPNQSQVQKPIQGRLFDFTTSAIPSSPVNPSFYATSLSTQNTNPNQHFVNNHNQNTPKVSENTHQQLLQQDLTHLGNTNLQQDQQDRQDFMNNDSPPPSQVIKRSMTAVQYKEAYSGSPKRRSGAANQSSMSMQVDDAAGEDQQREMMDQDRPDQIVRHGERGLGFINHQKTIKSDKQPTENRSSLGFVNHQDSFLNASRTQKEQNMESHDDSKPESVETLGLVDKKEFELGLVSNANASDDQDMVDNDDDENQPDSADASSMRVDDKRSLQPSGKSSVMTRSMARQKQSSNANQ